ncbi:MAG: hypothetical protein P8181_16915, partial [bacterium]
MAVRSVVILCFVILGLAVSSGVTCDFQCAWDHGWGSPGYDATWRNTKDANGNTYVVGSFSGTLDFGGGPRTGTAFLVKVDSYGNYLWDRTFVGGEGFGVAVNG